jgi:hypothetical protein
MDHLGAQSPSVASSCMKFYIIHCMHGKPRRTSHKWPHHVCNTTAYMAAGTVHMPRFPLCSSDTHTCTTNNTHIYTIKPQNLHHHTQLQLPLAVLSSITSCTANCTTSYMVLGILCSSLRLKQRLPHAAPTTQKAYQQRLLVQLLCHILVLCPRCVPPLACVVTPLKLQTYGSSMSHSLHQYLHHVNHHVASSSSSMENVVCLRRRSRFIHVSNHPRESLRSPRSSSMSTHTSHHAVVRPSTFNTSCCHASNGASYRSSAHEIQ